MHAQQVLAGIQGDRIQLVTEFCERGDLWTELSRDDSKYTWYRK